MFVSAVWWAAELATGIGEPSKAQWPLYVLYRQV